MTPTEKPQFVKLVTDVHAYYRQPVSEFTLGVWSQACERFSLEQMQKAFTGHATDPDRGQFCPKVADIIRILQGTHSDRAAIAWGKALEAMSAVGAYTDVVFDDAAVHAVIQDLGGWPKVCRTETKELGFLQHRFCEAHRAYTGRGTFDYPRKLMGDRSPDDAYEKRGLPPPRPALIGDSERAKRVYQGGGVGGKTQITFEPIASLTALSAPMKEPV